MATKPDEHTGASTTGGAASQPTAQAKAPDKAPVAASVATTRTPEQREAMAAATIGAQVILDYNGDGSIGARGGAGCDDRGKHDGPRRAPDWARAGPERPVRPADRRAVGAARSAGRAACGASRRRPRACPASRRACSPMPTTSPISRLRRRSAGPRRGGDARRAGGTS